MTRFMASIALLPVFLPGLYGCTHQQPVFEETTQLHAMPFNVVATGDPGTDATAATTFSWVEGSEPITGAQLMTDVPVNALLEESIVDILQQKGYQFTAATGEGDLLVSYAVTLNDAAADRKLAERYGMQADLNATSPEPDKFEKGTLVIDVKERQSGLSAWRSSLQGFAYLQISAAERRQRLQSMVRRMLAGLPSRD